MISAFEVKEALFEDREAGRRPVAPGPAGADRRRCGSWLKRAQPRPLLCSPSSPARGVVQAAERAGARASATSMPSRRFRSRALPRRSAFRTTGCRWLDPRRRHRRGACGGYGMQVYINLDYPLECRRPAADREPGLHADHLRAHGAFRRDCSRSAACCSSTGCRASTIRCSTSSVSPRLARSLLPARFSDDVRFDRERSARASSRASRPSESTEVPSEELR